MAIDDNELIEIQNLTDHTVGYISYEGKRRVLPGQAIVKVSAGELRALHYTKGGSVLLEECLSVKNAELAKEFGISDDLLAHEYNWTEKDVEAILIYGSLDALKDALDFAPEGIVDMIVSKAVQMKLNDVAKREAITEATGRNITSMINLVEQSKQDEQEAKENKPTSRRVSSTEKEQEKVRRVEE